MTEPWTRDLVKLTSEFLQGLLLQKRTEKGSRVSSL